jgi:hypothetical protein
MNSLKSAVHLNGAGRRCEKNSFQQSLQGVLMKSSRILAFLALAAMLVFVGGCSDDDNPANTPTLGTVSGRVTFAGNWPATGNVQVSLFDVWPATRAPYQASAVIPANSSTYDFKFEGLGKNSYPALVVGWRNPADPNPATASRVLGIYINDATKTGITVTTGQPAYDTPVPIVISDAKMVWTGVDLRGDLSLVQ